MAKVYISTHDSFVFYVMDESECNDTFGDDYIQDFGVEIPDNLLQEYKQAYNEFWKVQEKLKPYHK